MSIEEIIEAIDGLTVVELNDLVEQLQEKYGVSAAPVMMPGGAAGAAGEEAGGEEEKDEYDVHLAEIGDAKLQVIKAVREITSLGLKDAKALVDEAPSTIKEGVSKDEAEEMKAKLEEAGATIELK